MKLPKPILQLMLQMLYGNRTVSKHTFTKILKNNTDCSFHVELIGTKHFSSVNVDISYDTNTDGIDLFNFNHAVSNDSSDKFEDTYKAELSDSVLYYIKSVSKNLP